jgi:aminopeptidase-like protein
MKNRKYNIIDLVKRLFPYGYSVVGSENDKAIQAFQNELPFRIYKYRSGMELNGWIIPNGFKVIKAMIRKDNIMIYDATDSPLGVPVLSDSYTGSMTLDELKPHLFSAEKDGAIPYHWSNLYRTNQKEWGFCIPRVIKDKLTPGVYDINLETVEYISEMKVMVYSLPGKTEKTIILNAHNCHPFQANDDISGVAVGIEVMRLLRTIPDRRYTYKLMVAPELFGPMFWLDELDKSESSKIIGGIMLKSLGNDNNLKLQEGFTGKSPLDNMAHYVFKENYNDYESGLFRTIYGNDETVFESPPYLIPSISITRWPFPEYHTDYDTPEKLSENCLQESIDVVFQICKGLECNRIYKVNFSGLVCLSKYNLYKSVPVVGNSGVDYSSLPGRWNQLMNGLPSCLDGKTDLLSISQKYNLPLHEVAEYLKEWELNLLVKDVSDLSS